MSIRFSCNSFPDRDDEPVSATDAAERDAYYASLPPPEHAGPASVAELLARLDPHRPPAAEPARPDGSSSDEVSRWLADLATRPVGTTTRLAMSTLDPQRLSGTAVRDYLVLTDKVLAADTATQHRAVRAVADTARAQVRTALTACAAAAAGTRWSGHDTERVVREELERTLGCTPHDADARLQRAEDLADRVPATGELLAAGMVSARKASQFAHLLETTTPGVAAQIDSELADHLQDARPASLRKRVARRLLVLDGDHADAQDRQVVRARRVRKWSNPDGSATLAITGPPEAIQHAWYAATGVALAQLRDCDDGCTPTCPHATLAAANRDQTQPEDSVCPEADSTSTGRFPVEGGLEVGGGHGAVRRAADTDTTAPVGGARPVTDTDTTDMEETRRQQVPHVTERDGSARMDRARFDAAIDLLTSGYDAPWFPTSQGKRRTLVQLVTTVATLTGEDDNLSELVGHGAVTAETARRIAADAGMFQNLLVHPTMGFLMDAGTLRHDLPPGLREFLLARRPVCAMAGCTRPVLQAADLDHGIEHRADGTGGPTAAWAMHGLCRFHHRARTAGIWHLAEQKLDGSVVWIDPAGRQYVEPPHDLRPDAA